MKTDGASSIAPKSLAEVVRQVDNEKDLHEYILSHEGNEGAVAGDEVKYEPHPVSFALGQQSIRTRFLTQFSDTWWWS